MRKRDESGHDSFIMEEVERCLNNLAYGEIIITVHDSRVVQIEKREKRRFFRIENRDCSIRAEQKIKS